MKLHTLELALLLVLSVGCAGRAVDTGPGLPVESPREAVPPVLVIGLDGIEWDVVLPMLHARRLPNLEALMNRGVYGLLETTTPTGSPIIWTSIATGHVAHRHGIEGFVQDTAEGRRGGRLYNNLDRKTTAFWNILTDFDRRVAVIGWWMTYPVEAINGVMVAQVNTRERDHEQYNDKIMKGALYEGKAGQVHPAERQAEFLAVVPEVESELPEVLRGVFGDVVGSPGTVPALLWEKCLWAFRADEIYRRLSRRLLESEEFDLLAVYIGGTDVVGHRYWRYLFPDSFAVPPTDEEVEKLGGVIPAYYQHADRVVGELIAAAPDDAIVMVLSDHGMRAVNTHATFEKGQAVRAQRSAGHPDAPPGFFVAAGPGIRGRNGSSSPEGLAREDLPVVGSVVDITPTLLVLMDLPLGRDMEGRVLEGVIDPAFLDVHPVTTVDSHTPPGWYEARSGGPVDEIESEERMEQLRALGYVGGEDDDE